MQCLEGNSTVFAVLYWPSSCILQVFNTSTSQTASSMLAKQPQTLLTNVKLQLNSICCTTTTAAAAAAAAAAATTTVSSASVMLASSAAHVQASTCSVVMVASHSSMHRYCM